MKKNAFALLGAAFVLSACASSSDEIATQYVSPLQYKDYNCNQISMEMERVTRRRDQLQMQVDDNAEGDAVATGVGVILFWPALFFIDGDGPEAQEYGRLKGEAETLEKVAIEKECGIDFTQYAPKVEVKEDTTNYPENQ